MRKKFMLSQTEHSDRKKSRIALAASIAALSVILVSVVCVQAVLSASAAKKDMPDKISTLTQPHVASAEGSADSVLKITDDEFAAVAPDEVDLTETNEFFITVLETIGQFIKCSNGEGGAIVPGSENVIEEIVSSAETASAEATTAAETTTVETTAAQAGYSFDELGISQISTIDVPDDVRFTADGVPLDYAYAISGKTTAYSSGYITSTGTAVYPGIVAVDPGRIPYGSRLWIVGYDGNVYGYGIAADTGGFIYFNDPPVADLYMYSESQCDWWGVRGATVYVLN